MPRNAPRSAEEIQAAIQERLETIRSWGLTKEDLETLIAENPHVYSPVSGFHAEYKCRQLCLNIPEISDISRPSGYDKKEKGDFVFSYRGEVLRLEVKSLDGPKVVRNDNDRWQGTFQCNASDARAVELPNGHTVTTNCIVAGGWDVLAVNLYDFGRQWRFAFAKQSDLPRASTQYPDVDRKHLLASSMSIELPLSAPFRDNLKSVLDEIIRTRRKRS